MVDRDQDPGRPDGGELFDWLQTNGGWFFWTLSDALEWMIDAILTVLQGRTRW